MGKLPGSEAVRGASAHLAEKEGEQFSALHRLKPFIGIIDSGGKQLSTDTGRRFRELLEKQRPRRRSGRRSGAGGNA